jgi:hypothetical protein
MSRAYRNFPPDATVYGKRRADLHARAVEDERGEWVGELA